MPDRLRPLWDFGDVDASEARLRDISVRLSVTDWHPRGNSVEDGIAIARAMRETGADLIHVEAGQTIHDDRPEYLSAAAPVGFHCLLMDRDVRHGPATIPPYVEATLRNLAGLPQYIEHAVRAARARA